MNDTKENITLKSMSQEEFYELPENKEERSCTASECIFTSWSKPISVNEFTFVSKDVLLIRVEKTLIFHNVATQKEDIVVVGGKNCTPAGGDSLPLDGIGCVDCCNSMDLLALAEQPPIAKVVICRYADLKVLATLIDNGNSATYKSILFLRLEYLIGLRDYPAFDLIVWAWRIQEKLFVVNTEFIQPNQSLNLSAIGRVVYLSQIERDVKCKLQLWTMFISCKTISTKKTLVKLPSNVDVGSGCWTPSGWFVFCDSSMNVYRTQPGIPNAEMCIEHTEDDSRKQCALMCSTKHGFMLYTANHLTCFKDSKGIFTRNWTIVVNHALRCMVAGENDVYGWSNEGILLELTHKRERILKVYGTSIKYFTFIKPTDETVATINENNVLQVWDVTTGQLKSEKNINGIATSVCSNPVYFYVTIPFKNGKVELLKTDPKVNNIENIAKIVLCDEELSLVNFFPDGNECVVTSFPTGQFYYINIKLGHMCSVVREHHLKKQVIDVKIFHNKMSSFLAVLYKTQETTDIVGNNIVIFDSNFNIVFELKNTRFYYTSVFKWIPFDTHNMINIAFAMPLSKCIHLMKIDISQENVSELEIVPLSHYVKNVSVGKYHCVTFSYDGTYTFYVLDDENWKNIVTVNCSHWQTGGLIAAQVDIKARNILTLSREGNFICTSFKETCNHIKRFQQIERIDMPIIINDMETKGIGYEDGPETPKRMTWIMINKDNELNASKVAYNEQKNQIIREFEQIKKELLTLFETNVNGPEDTKINIEEFDLNVDYKLKFREKCKIERREYKAKILGDLNKFKMETEDILKEHWELLFVKPKSIYCLKELYKVDNYPISKKDQEVIEKANQIIEKRISLKSDELNATNVHKSFSKNYLELLDDELKLQKLNDRQSTDTLLFGSISHRFVDTINCFNSQYDYYKLEMAKDEIILLQFMINKLKHEFNKLFDEFFIEKQSSLDILKKYNDRLRVIETEFRLACKVEHTEVSPIDYKWNQYEKTEQLIYVEDDEVPVKQYNLISSKQLISPDMSTAKNEQIERSLAIDDFRQKLLNNMMDGVLEKRWEDELKKDVPKPQCLLEINPEEYTEEDLKCVREYEKLVLIRNDERIKYKKILEDEKTKIIQLIKESIVEVDNNVFKLFRIKLKYNSAIHQEYLKINRLSKMLSESDQQKQQIKLHRENIMKIEQIITETTKKIVKTEATYNSLLNTIETLKHKNSVLNKRFKIEFPSKLIYEQALIAYNRRPKLQGITNYSSLLGYQFVNTIMDPINDKLDLLYLEFVKYLDILKVYDDYKYVDDYKLNMDKETWNKVCNFRRLKIESEFKISTYQKDAIDKANLLDNLMRVKEDNEAIIENLKMSVDKLENQNFQYEDDPEIQIVVKQGNTEIELTGHYTDFDDTILIAKNVIDEVNAEIKEMGKIKIDALSKLLKFKSKCQFLKWDHEILQKHKIPLYKYRFDFITSMKVTENMLHYLKFKEKGINIDKLVEQKVEKELAAIQIIYSKDKELLKQRLDELVNKIRNVRKENKKIDKEIKQTNFYLSELKNKIDYNLTNKLKSISDSRMNMIVKRTQMISNIQELHKNVFILQTELELLLLKTFPTLYSNPQSTSLRK